MITLFLFCAAPSGSVDFFLAGSQADSIPRADEVFFLRQGEALIFYPVIERNGCYYSAAEVFIKDNDTVTVDGSIDATITWYAITPVFREYENLRPRQQNTPPVCIEPVQYLKSGPMSQDYILDFPGEMGDTLGTFYVCCSINTSDTVLDPIPSDSFTSTEPLHRSYRHKVIQVVVRTDDSYMGYLTEMFNVPFTLPPMRTRTGWHQCDERMGADCAEFAIYGKRRQGFEVAYLGPRGIYRYLDEIAPSKLFPAATDHGVVYQDTSGNTVRVGDAGLVPGDILHFGAQVSVFYADGGVPGVLDPDDLVVQSYIPGTYVTSIKEGSFFHLPVRVFKWKEDLPLRQP